jgi:hypothetical protein
MYTKDNIYSPYTSIFGQRSGVGRGHYLWFGATSLLNGRRFLLHSLLINTDMSLSSGGCQITILLWSTLAAIIKRRLAKLAHALKFPESTSNCCTMYYGDPIRMERVILRQEISVSSSPWVGSLLYVSFCTSWNLGKTPRFWSEMVQCDGAILPFIEQELEMENRGLAPSISSYAILG